MKTKLLVFVAIVGAFLAQGASAAQVFNGVDTQGRACQVVIQSLSFGPIVMHDACDFEMDGPGPWCDHLKPVPTRRATGSGVYATAAGTMPFVINDGLMFDSPTPSIAASTQLGGTVSLKLTGPRSVSAYYAFMTPYGRTLSPAQIRSLLLNRNSNVPYQEVYRQIFEDVTCNARR